MSREISITLLLVTATAAMVIGRQCSRANTTAETEWRTVEVVPGDTLWHIALQTSLPGSDVRQTLHQILRANHRRSSLIEPGDLIVVPVLRDAERFARKHGSKAG